MSLNWFGACVMLFSYPSCTSHGMLSYSCDMIPQSETGLAQLWCPDCMSHPVSCQLLPANSNTPASQRSQLQNCGSHLCVKGAFTGHQVQPPCTPQAGHVTCWTPASLAGAPTAPHRPTPQNSSQHACLLNTNTPIPIPPPPPPPQAHTNCLHS
jgi:hypothetical protein